MRRRYALFGEALLLRPLRVTAVARTSERQA